MREFAITAISDLINDAKNYNCHEEFIDGLESALNIVEYCLVCEKEEGIRDDHLIRYLTDKGRTIGEPGVNNSRVFKPLLFKNRLISGFFTLRNLVLFLFERY